MDPEWTDLIEAQVRSDERYRRALEKWLDKHPANGIPGWWQVNGHKHSVLVYANSAREAYVQAERAGVERWEEPTLLYITVDSLQRAFNPTFFWWRKRQPAPNYLGWQCRYCATLSMGAILCSCDYDDAR